MHLAEDWSMSQTQLASNASAAVLLMHQTAAVIRASFSWHQVVDKQHCKASLAQ
jgi:hypothetical protein